MMTDWGLLADEITDWIREYSERNGVSTLVVGVSGGIDSSVSSTLSARTGLDTFVLNMPINQDIDQFELSNRHIRWLEQNWSNVKSVQIDLSKTIDVFRDELDKEGISELAIANSKARLRMAALYAIAGSNDGIVVGTGNKVEDFGVGFFTKYGDGGVDISPIADLYKSEVYSLGRELGVLKEVIDAPPTDGLWDDGRTDEDQMGASYTELEWAMEHESLSSEISQSFELSERQKEVLEVYKLLHNSNGHKMRPIPVFKRRTEG